jgi:hypothetical protein
MPPATSAYLMPRARDPGPPGSYASTAGSGWAEGVPGLVWPLDTRDGSVEDAITNSSSRVGTSGDQRVPQIVACQIVRYACL